VQYFRDWVTDTDVFKQVQGRIRNSFDISITQWFIGTTGQPGLNRLRLNIVGA
jgi:hypothetical protein